MNVRAQLLKEYIHKDYYSDKRKKELDADTPGSDWLIVYDYDDSNEAWVATTQSNYEYFMKRLGDNCLDEWKWRNTRPLWANMANDFVRYEVEDIRYALERHGDLDSDRSTQIQEMLDIEYIEDNKPKYLLEEPPDEWAWHIHHWITNHGSGEFDHKRIDEAAYALGFLSGGYCPTGHVHYHSTTKEHWTWYITVDETDAAYDRFKQWQQQAAGAMLTEVLPGFTRTHVPYPGQYDAEMDCDVVDRVNGKFICPKCGATMEDKE